MSFIRLSFTHPELADPDAPADVVGMLHALGFPVCGKAERFFVLHENGVVSQWATSLDAHRALLLPGSELLLWLLPDTPDAAVAAEVVLQGTRITCRLGLAGAPREDQHGAARAIDQLLQYLIDVELEAELEPLTAER